MKSSFSAVLATFVVLTTCGATDARVFSVRVTNISGEPVAIDFSGPSGQKVTTTLPPPSHPALKVNVYRVREGEVLSARYKGRVVLAVTSTERQQQIEHYIRPEDLRRSEETERKFVRSDFPSKRRTASDRHVSFHVRNHTGHDVYLVFKRGGEDVSAQTLPKGETYPYRDEVVGDWVYVYSSFDRYCDETLGGSSRTWIHRFPVSIGLHGRTQTIARRSRSQRTTGGDANRRGDSGQRHHGRSRSDAELRRGIAKEAVDYVIFGSDPTPGVYEKAQELLK